VKVGAVPALRERGMADDTIVYLSSAADVPLPPGVKTWVRFGEDAVEKTLGVSVGSENQVREQWSDLFYEEQVQVPDTADEEIEKTQRVFDEAVFGITGKGGRAFVRYSQSYQLWEDGGIDNIDLAKRMKAEWAARASSKVIARSISLDGPMHRRCRNERWRRGALSPHCAVE